MTKYQLILTFGKENQRRIVEVQETATSYNEAKFNISLFAQNVAPGDDWKLVHISHDPDRDVLINNKPAQ